MILHPFQHYFSHIGTVESWLTNRARLLINSLLESFTPTFGLGTPVFFQELLQIYIVGLLLFLKDVSGTPIFKILVRTLQGYVQWTPV